MNLHGIPREIQSPRIDPTWERAAGRFQHDYKDLHPVVVTINKNNEVIDMGYRNGNFMVDGIGRLQANGLSSPLMVRDWSSRDGFHPLDWNKVEILTEEQVRNDPNRWSY